MDEKELKSKLMQRFKSDLPTYVTLRHEEVRNSGTPDITTTGGTLRLTTWIEVKYANPDFKSHGIQELTMLRLEAAGSARYVVYEEDLEGRRQTHMFRPSEMKSGVWKGVKGFDHAWVVKQIQAIHEGQRWQSH